MGSFRHHPDDHIIINEVIFPLAFFELQEPTYTLPAPYISREYIQSPPSHIFSDGQTQVDAGLPYADGDTYISNLATYEAAYEEYLNPTPSLPEAKIIRIAEAAAYNRAKKTEKVVYSSDTYFSDEVFFYRINHEYQKFNRDGSVPGGYYVKDEDDTQVSLNLSQLEDLVDHLIDFYYECDKVFDTHEVNINALTTVEDIEAYNFTTGWPTTPYT